MIDQLATPNRSDVPDTPNGARDLPLLLRMDQAAHLLSISRSRAYQLAATGDLPGLVVIGGSYRVARAVLENWIAANANGGQTEATDGDRVTARKRAGA